MFELLEEGLHTKLIKDAEILSRHDKDGVSRRVFCFKGDAPSLVDAELRRIEEETGGIFTHCLQKGVTATNERFGTVAKYRHICERYGKPKGRNAAVDKSAKTLARLTRANGCRAYVSHLIAKKGDVKVCVQRLFNVHNGHDPTNPADNCKSKLLPELIDMINEWIGSGCKPNQILSRAINWSRSQGYYDQRNRRYYPTKKDIDNLCQLYKRKFRSMIFNTDADLSTLCESTYKENVVYFQNGDDSNSIPTFLIVQSRTQFDQFKRYGQGVCILNATYNAVATHGYSLYTLLVRNERNKPIPVGFCFMSDESEDLIFEFMSRLRTAAVEKGFTWRPRAVIVDTDWKEIHAVNRLFNSDVPILLCWFRMLQEEEFELLWEDLISRLPVIVAIYLTETWKPISALWANYGRTFFRNFAEANLAIEQLFCTVKWQFFKQYINRPIDELLQFLMVDILIRTSNISLLVEPGKLSKSDIVKQTEEIEKAKAMLEKGDANRIIWHSENNYQTVPSETQPDVSYIVNVAEMRCSCQHATYGVKCKHLCLVEMSCLTQSADVDQIREHIANDIFVSGDYQLLDNIFMVVNSSTGFVNCVDLTWDKCVCPAASYGLQCVCLKVVRLYKEFENAGGIVVVSGAYHPVADVGTTPPGDSYEEIVDDIGAVEIAITDAPSTSGVDADNGFDDEIVDSGVAWMSSAVADTVVGTSGEGPEIEDQKNVLSNVEMSRFDDTATSPEEARLLCENILAKLNAGCKPSNKWVENLRRLANVEGTAWDSSGRTVQDTLPPEGAAKRTIVKIVKKNISAVSMRSALSKK